MKKITKEALKAMLSKKSGWNMLNDGVKNLLLDVVLKHVTTGKWENGNPKDVFRAVGCYCVRYQNGMWWHYDLVNKTWF
mgnify:FL=1